VETRAWGMHESKGPPEREILVQVVERRLLLEGVYEHWKPAV